MVEVPHNTLRTLLRSAAVIAVLMLIGYFALLGFAGFEMVRSSGGDSSRAGMALTEGFQSVGRGAWEFARPLLQLLIVLVIIDWILRQMGIQFASGVQSFKWDVQAIIAIIVIAAYAVSELGGIGSGGMKDIALVVVGFYFGTQRRSYEVDPQTGKMRVIEEHDNTVPTAKSAGSPENTGTAPQPGTLTSGYGDVKPPA